MSEVTLTEADLPAIDRLLKKMRAEESTPMLTLSETMLLWCHHCYKLQAHVKIERGVKYGDKGRLVHGTCSKCNGYFAGGYVVYERLP